LSAGGADLVWYAVAVVMLVPPIAVLGARRPVNRVWPWFVLVPLVLIFAWPALSAFRGGRAPAAWSIEEPVFVGYALVAVMGAGNYVGLRHTIPALMWMAALMLLVGPLCPATAPWMPAPSTARAWSMLLIAAAAWLSAGFARRPDRASAATGPVSLDGVWLDFRDLFGIVWARRVQERFNEEMRRSNSPVRLGIHGFENAVNPGRALATLPSTDLNAAESSLRWLLQKFVDPEWIDRRLARGR
jgi:hypothetical protein